MNERLTLGQGLCRFHWAILLGRTLLLSSMFLNAHAQDSPVPRPEMKLAEGRDFTAVPSRLLQGFLWTVDARINGVNLRMGFDTGSHRTFLFSRKHAQASGFTILEGPSFDETTGERAQWPRVKVDRMEIGEITITQYEAPIYEKSAPGIQGILGWDLLARFLVEFDPDERRVVIWRSEKFVDPPGAIILPLYSQPKPPRLSTDLQIGPHPARAMFDSGYPGSFVVTPRFAERHPLESFAEKIPFRQSRTWTPGDGEWLRIRSISSGAWKLENPAAFLPIARKAFGKSAFDAIICGEQTNRYHCYYDLPKGRLLLVPRPSPAPEADSVGAEGRLTLASPAVANPAPDLLTQRLLQGPGRYGAHFTTRDGRLIIDEVKPGSAFAEGGVQAGDTVLAIDGEKVGTSSSASIERTKTFPAGARFKLVIQRKGEELPRELEIVAP